MLMTLTAILICQLSGEFLVLMLDLPVPGPVIGMLILLVALIMVGGPSQSFEITVHNLLSHLSLLFVPAGVGVMAHFDRISNEWLAVSVALIGSTLIGLGITAWIMSLISRLTGRKQVARGR